MAGTSNLREVLLVEALSDLDVLLKRIEDVPDLVERARAKIDATGDVVASKFDATARAAAAQVINGCVAGVERIGAEERKNLQAVAAVERGKIPEALTQYFRQQEGAGRWKWAVAGAGIVLASLCLGFAAGYALASVKPNADTSPPASVKQAAPPKAR